jgi:hypothetical protein
MDSVDGFADLKEAFRLSLFGGGAEVTDLRFDDIVVRIER